jgi:Asp-tRNA(Asn)/Glu-tRNA(Gln) amidotransferase A subunit family amidase
VENVQKGNIDPSDMLMAYGKKALKAHEETNCLTEVMISPAQTWAKCCANGPLAGMPVSLKDTVGVEGWDSSIGYSAWVNKPLRDDSTLVKLLRDAGAVPFVKTSIPITLLSFESTSDLFGVTSNPHKKSHSPGGSSGGEGALLAYGGSRIGIGTDVAGSVRCPAHYSGVYTIKASMYRFLKTGSTTSMPGQEGVPAVYSPMARTLEDLETFWKAIFSMKPWTYDHSVSTPCSKRAGIFTSMFLKCLHIPWRDVDLSHTKLKWGVMWQDGMSCRHPP